MLSDKKLAKIEKVLGKEIMSGLEGGQVDELKSTIAAAAQAIKQVGDELEANETFQTLKESVKDMSAAFKEVKKFQNAKIQYCLSLIEEKGKL